MPGAAFQADVESDMTPEERQMLADLFERIKATSATPRDAQAEAFINDAARAAPFAPYVLAQTVLVQQHALEAAAHRIAELEAARAESRSAAGSGKLPRQPGQDDLWRRRPSAAAPARPSYEAPAYQRGPGAAPGPGYPPPPQAYGAPQPGPWGAPAPSRGGGFLQNAASTAAGVAGGVALGNLLGGLFGGHSGGGLFGSGFGGAGIPGGGNETVNIFEDGSGNQSGNPMDAAQFDPGVPDDAGYIDDSSFDDSSGGDGGGFDDV